MNLRQPVEYAELCGNALRGGQVFRKIERALKKLGSLLVCEAPLCGSRFDANISDRTIPICASFEMMRKVGCYIGQAVAEQVLQLLSRAQVNCRSTSRCTDPKSHYEF